MYSRLYFTFDDFVCNVTNKQYYSEFFNGFDRDSEKFAGKLKSSSLTVFVDGTVEDLPDRLHYAILSTKDSKVKNVPVIKSGTLLSVLAEAWAYCINLSLMPFYNIIALTRSKVIAKSSANFEVAMLISHNDVTMFVSKTALIDCRLYAKAALSMCTGDSSYEDWFTAPECLSAYAEKYCVGPSSEKAFRKTEFYMLLSFGYYDNAPDIWEDEYLFRAIMRVYQFSIGMSIAKPGDTVDVIYHNATWKLLHESSVRDDELMADLMSRGNESAYDIIRNAQQYGWTANEFMKMLNRYRMFGADIIKFYDSRVMLPQSS